MWRKFESRRSCFLVALCGAVPVTQTTQSEQGRLLTDASSFLQQHTTATAALQTPSSSMPWSRTSLMALFEDFTKEVEASSVEDSMRLYRRAQSLANLSRISLEDKGFMLLQEAGKIFGKPSMAKVLDSVRDTLTQVEQSSGKNEAFSCYSSLASLPVNLVGAIFATFITVTCDSTGTCTSEGLESVRYLVSTLQHWTGQQSYCADEPQTDSLCKASVYELGVNAAGISSNIAGAVYRCPQWSGDGSRKVAGMKVASIRCTLGYAKGSSYLAIAISKVAEMYIRLGESVGKQSMNEMEEHVALSAQLGAALSWIVQLVLLMSGNCKGDPGDIACAGEIVEVMAFIAQAVTSGLMANSYCFNSDPAGSEQDTMKPVGLGRDNLKPDGLEQDNLKPNGLEHDQSGSLANDETKPNSLAKTSVSNDPVTPLDGIFDSTKLKINEERDGPMQTVIKIVSQVGTAVSEIGKKFFTREEHVHKTGVQDDSR